MWIEAPFVLFTDNEGQGRIQKWTIKDKRAKAQALALLW